MVIRMCIETLRELSQLERKVKDIEDLAKDHGIIINDELLLEILEESVNSRLKNNTRSKR